MQLPEKYKEKFDVSRSVSIDSLSFALYVKRQTPGKEKIYGIRQYRGNELAVLKLKYIIILSMQERKYETKVFNENFAKKVRT
jgi:hypothetical protein